MKNKGNCPYRFKQNPREFEFAMAWDKINTNQQGRLDGRGVLDYLMAKKANHPAGEVTERDREVAATVIQWLGSHVGQYFLHELNKKEG